MDLSDLIERLDALNATEVSSLRNSLEEKWGVKAVEFMPSTTELSVEIKKVEQQEFSVFLTGFGASKMGVIKTVRELMKLGLGECKAFVEASANEPKEVKSGTSLVDAQEIKRLIEVAGGTAEVK